VHARYRREISHSCASWRFRSDIFHGSSTIRRLPTSFPQTIVEVAPLLRDKKISPIELTRTCLGKIEKLNPALNAFITVTADSALAQARAAEDEIAHGNWRGPLHGVPIALKDLIDTAGVRTTAGSALFKDRVPTEDAEIVRRLKQAGAVILGKNNLHEFAYGGSSLVSHFGDVHNPWNIAHIAGGSSGGSAAAVAASLCYAAIGTDTAGSIREPAALCGCVGLKPTAHAGFYVSYYVVFLIFLGTLCAATVKPLWMLATRWMRQDGRQ